MSPLCRAAAGVAFVTACFAPITLARAAAPEDSTITAVRESPLQRNADRTSVVGSRGQARSLPGSAHYLGPDVLPFQDQSFDNIGRLLMRLPGVYAIGEDGYGLRPNLGMRGVAPYRSAGLTIMEDGVLAAPAPYAAPGLPVFAGLGRTESIEVLKGSSQIPYGPQTAGGVINLPTLPTPDDLVAQARLSLGTYDAHTMHVDYGDSWKGVSWLLGTHQTRTDGFKALDGGGDTGFEHDDYLIKLAFATGLHADHYQNVLFKTGWFRTDARDSYLGLTDEDFAATPYRRYAASEQDRMKHEAGQLLLRHFIVLNDALDVTTSLYRNEVDMDWYLLESVNGENLSDVLSSPTAFADEYHVLTGDSTSADDALTVKANAHAYFSTGIESKLGAVFGTGGARHNLEVGLRYHEDEEDRLDRIDGYRMVGGGAMVLTSQGPDGGAGGSDNQVNQAKALAGFVRDRISGDKVSVTPGLRVEYVRTTQTSYAAGDAERSTATSVVENSTTALLPGIGVAYRATPDVLLLGGIHTGFTPPTPARGGDGDRAVQYEAGARAKNGGLEAAVIGFVNDRSWAGAASWERASGVEVSAGYEIHDPEYGVALTAAYTFTHAEYLGGDVALDYAGVFYSASDGDDVPYVPEHAATAALVLTTRKSYASVVANFASHMRTQPGSGDFVPSLTADDRFLLDIVTEYELIRHVRIFASVYNVIDDAYVASRFPYGAHPGAPRTFTAGLKLQL